MQNEIIPTLMSHHPKLKLSLFHTHFVLQKTVKFALPNATVASIVEGTTYHNKSQKQKPVKFTLPNAMVAGNARGTTYHNKS